MDTWALDVEAVIDENKLQPKRLEVIAMLALLLLLRRFAQSWRDKSVAKNTRVAAYQRWPKKARNLLKKKHSLGFKTRKRTSGP